MLLFSPESWQVKSVQFNPRPLFSLPPDLQTAVLHRPGYCSLCPVSVHFWRLRNPRKPGRFHQFEYFTFFPYQKELVPIQKDGYSQDGTFLESGGHFFPTFCFSHNEYNLLTPGASLECYQSYVS